MSIVHWDGSLSTGVESLDVQHKELFRIINSMEEKLAKGHPDNAFIEGLDSLRGYIKYHFRTEESYMEIHEYPEFESHRDEHLGFVDRVEELSADIRQDTQKKTEELLTFLLTWLVQHIRRRDLPFGEFLCGCQAEGRCSL
jgi:hemerythrin